MSLAVEEHRAVSWCAATDVASGVTRDDPEMAIEGWCHATRRALTAIGRDPDADPIVRAVARVGRAGVAAVYAAERQAILATEISARRHPGD